MRRTSLVFAMLLLGPVAGAEVVRCADAAGNVSYTDGACPVGARTVGRVSILQAPPPAADSGERPVAVPREPPAPIVHAPPVPSGPGVIGGGALSNQPTGDPRWSDRGSDPMLVDDGSGYAYPGYGGTYGRPAAPARDMRPRIRNCDAGGCDDRQGNRYNQSGQLERYRSIDGKTCQPIGTTTVCR